MIDEQEVERLHNTFKYVPETGKFFRKVTRGRFKEGSEVESNKTKDGSWYPKIKWRLANGKDTHISFQRLAWILENGNIEDNKVVDHINGDINDNRIVNLRVVTRAENSRNRKTAKNNTSGTQGVYLVERDNDTFWKAEIRHNYDNIFIGSYNTREEAIIARKAAERVLGFHDNHGRKTKGKQC